MRDPFALGLSGAVAAIDRCRPGYHSRLTPRRTVIYGYHSSIGPCRLLLLHASVPLIRAPVSRYNYWKIGDSRPILSQREHRA